MTDLERPSHEAPKEGDESSTRERLDSLRDELGYDDDGLVETPPDIFEDADAVWRAPRSTTPEAIKVTEKVTIDGRTFDILPGTEIITVLVDMDGDGTPEEVKAPEGALLAFDDNGDGSPDRYVYVRKTLWNSAGYWAGEAIDLGADALKGLRDLGVNGYTVVLKPLGKEAWATGEAILGEGWQVGKAVVGEVWQGAKFVGTEVKAGVETGAADLAAGAKTVYEEDLKPGVAAVLDGATVVLSDAGGAAIGVLGGVKDWAYQKWQEMPSLSLPTGWKTVPDVLKWPGQEIDSNEDIEKDGQRYQEILERGRASLFARYDKVSGNGAISLNSRPYHLLKVRVNRLMERAVYKLDEEYGTNKTIKADKIATVIKKYEDIAGTENSHITPDNVNLQLEALTESMLDGSHAAFWKPAALDMMKFFQKRNDGNDTPMGELPITWNGAGTFADEMYQFMSAINWGGQNWSAAQPLASAENYAEYYKVVIGQGKKPQSYWEWSGEKAALEGKTDHKVLILKGAETGPDNLEIIQKDFMDWFANNPELKLETPNVVLGTLWDEGWPSHFERSVSIRVGQIKDFVGSRTKKEDQATVFQAELERFKAFVQADHDLVYLRLQEQGYSRYDDQSWLPTGELGQGIRDSVVEGPFQNYFWERNGSAGDLNEYKRHLRDSVEAELDPWF